MSSASNKLNTSDKALLEKLKADDARSLKKKSSKASPSLQKKMQDQVAHAPAQPKKESSSS
jgi:hypothetical protein